MHESPSPDTVVRSPEALTSECGFATEDPGKYIRRLCKHFNHRVPAQWNEQGGEVQFPMGSCSLRAGDGVLNIQCRAAGAEALVTVQSILETHIEQLAWREKPEVRWLPASTVH